MYVYVYVCGLRKLLILISLSAHRGTGRGGRHVFVSLKQPAALVIPLIPKSRYSEKSPKRYIRVRIIFIISRTHARVYLRESAECSHPAIKCAINLSNWVETFSEFIAFISRLLYEHAHRNSADFILFYFFLRRRVD